MDHLAGQAIFGVFLFYTQVSIISNIPSFHVADLCLLQMGDSRKKITRCQIHDPNGQNS